MIKYSYKYTQTWEAYKYYLSFLNNSLYTVFDIMAPTDLTVYKQQTVQSFTLQIFNATFLLFEPSISSIFSAVMC